MRTALTTMSLVVCLLLGPAAARAAAVFVEPATGSGVTPAELETATHLVRLALGELGTSHIAPTAGEAEITLRPHLLRLGKAYLLGLEKVRANEIVFSSQLKAEEIEELDKVALRLTRSVMDEKAAKSDGRVGEVTHQEAHEGTERQPVRRQWYLGFGTASMENLNTNGIGFDLGAAYGWDFNDARLKIQGDWAIKGSATFWDVGLGAQIFFSRADVAPYVSGDFGFGFAKADGGGLVSGTSQGGFDGGIGIGFELFRTHETTFDLGGRYGWLFHPNSYGHPGSFSFRVGVNF